MSIQDYNTRLENNNTNLNEILNAINNLPTLKLQDKSVTPTKEKQTIKADETYNGLGSVSVEAIPSSYVEPSGTLEINENGEYDVTNYKNVVANIESSGGSGSYAPRYVSFRGYTGTELDQEIANLDTSNVTNMSNMFASCSSTTTLDLSHFNTSNVTNMSSMFSSDSYLKTLILSNFNTSKVTDMSYMFSSCQRLVMPSLTHFDTSNVTTMASMFANCFYYSTVEAELDLTNFNTSKVTNMSSMFNNNKYLTSLDLSTWDTSNVTNMSSMFYGCSKLTKLDIRNFDFTKVTSYSSMFNSIPTNCEIIVQGQTEKDWVLNKRSQLTNVKTTAEIGQGGSN